MIFGVPASGEVWRVWGGEAVTPWELLNHCEIEQKYGLRRFSSIIFGVPFDRAQAGGSTHVCSLKERSKQTSSETGNPEH
jgi:hypothetical protein